MEEIKSTIGIKTSKNREEDRYIISWLQHKQADDGAEGLWRVHDKLYDFSKFISIHPGGKDWLVLTKGTDITEAFESHHNSPHIEEMLKKYFIKNSITPRSYPFTFDDTGFYKTLKRNVREAMKNIPSKEVYTAKSQLFIDLFLFATFFTSILAVRWSSYLLTVVAAYFLTCTTIAAHNYLHKKDNFRMYYFDFSLMSSRDWRISHVLSHHLYTNTVRDLEISLFEPMFRYLPIEKSLLVKYGSWLYFLPIISSIFIMSALMRYQNYVMKRDAFRNSEFIPFLLPLAMFLLGNFNIQSTVITWVFIVFGSSLIFGVVGMAAHHHPKIFHDGDAARDKEDMDWGLFQLDTVMDRYDITGNHYLVLTNFGDHGLHHLFPTLDHGVLQFLYPVFEQTAKQFNIRLRMRTELQMLKGLFLQLARDTPNKIPPSKLKS